MRPKLLFLSAFLPSRDAAQAGQKTAFRHLEWLAAKHEVHFLGFRNEADDVNHVDRLRLLCRSVEVWPVTRRVRWQGALQRPDLPLLVAARWSRDFARAVRRSVRERKFARVHCEWTQMAAYLPAVSSVPIRWVSAHDVVTQFCARAADSSAGFRRVLWQFEAARARRWETRIAADATHLLVQSGKDADIIAQSLDVPRRKVRVVAPYFERHAPRMRAPRPGTGPTMLFWGALGRIENSEAAKWLARELMPHLRAKLPGATLFIAGANPDAELRAMESADVRITGFVRDPRMVFSDADLAVLPLFRGAGIKVKVLECLAAGLPVLTSAIGAEGIPAIEADGLYVRVPDGAAYADIIAGWWRSEGELSRLSAAALRWGDAQARPNEDFFSDK